MNKHDSPCKYFIRGECNKGEKCNYKHLSKNEIPCKYFHGLGSCENEKCEVEASKKIGLNEDGHPMGYECPNYINKFKKLKKYTLN